MTTTIRGARKSTTSLLARYFELASREDIGKTPCLTYEINALEKKIKQRKAQEASAK